ncbi:LPS-assembly protein LptD [Flavobacterium sp. Sd200]|uniref:putative LPS assembly protein LptD n=1 Tax=Flavobacterium sp. Sd200 TaxID=2692211 RepID=UPI0013699D0B|nr:putative LPS assembly protein LptD [Flavobacterium sp. Sd200]MXN90637.1 LPS-assembly protein LptD [Flavobacterium sp. Sd200]
MRTNLFHIVLLAIFLTVGGSTAFAQEIKSKKPAVPAEKQNSSTKTEKQPDAVAAPDNTAIPDTTEVAIAKPVADTVKKKGIDAIIKRSAKDYEKVDQKKKELTLYNEAELYYKDIELKAGVIIMNYEKDEVFAGRLKDSLGNYSQLPYFKQGSNIVEADSIHFNTVSKKARVWNSRSDQGEFTVFGEVTKKENDSVYFMKNAKFTTSKNKKNPEYYFLARKIKLVPGEKVVVGPTNMYIADVPTPLGIPFAFFPMTTKAESGFIIPSYGDSNARGYYLQDGGYYLALSDYYDLAVTGDYYTNGSYGFRFQSNYANRYHYSGNLNIRFENLVTSERGLPDYARANNYNIQWSHSQDSKASPNSRFAASVNLGSSRYFRQSMNTANIGSSLNNTLQSSVSYSKTFQTVPQVNFSLSATHSQNTNTQVINMTLPTLQASVDRIFPFAPGDAPKKGIIKNLNLQYNLRGENRIATTDSLFFKPEMFRDAKSGMQHSIPISTNFKIFKHFSVSAGTNYQETWVMNTINRSLVNDTIVTRDVKGFDSYRTYNFSSSIGTTVYGMFNFGDDKKIQAIRQVIRPSISYSYTPSFDQYYDTYQLDNTGTQYRDYTRFEGGLFGAPGNSYSNNIGIAVNNTFEAKVRNDDENATEEDKSKKVMLLNNLNFTTSYNMAADSLAWSPLRVTAGTALFKDKMNINFGATLDPYALSNSGQRIDTYNIDNGGSLFRLTSANVTLNYSISSDEASGNKKNEDSQTARNGGRTDDLFGVGNDMNNGKSMFGDEEEDDSKKKDKSEGTFFNAKLPWNLNLAYSLTYNNNNRERKVSGSSLMVSGNVDITPRWKMGFSSGYDFVQKGVTFTQLRFERDLLSWRMDFNWVPFGTNTYWGFFIGIKSSILSDIKYDKRQVPDRVIR